MGKEAVRAAVRAVARAVAKGVVKAEARVVAKAAKAEARAAARAGTKALKVVAIVPRLMARQTERGGAPVSPNSETGNSTSGAGS